MIDPDDTATLPQWATASLRIATELLTVDEISDRLDLRPTSWRVSDGDPEFTVWMHESALETSAPIEDHLYLLMERLRERKDALAALSESATAEIWLSFSVSDTAGESILDHRVLSEIADVGCDLVLDPQPSRLH